MKMLSQAMLLCFFFVFIWNAIYCSRRESQYLLLFGVYFFSSLFCLYLSALPMMNIYILFGQKMKLENKHKNRTLIDRVQLFWLPWFKLAETSYESKHWTKKSTFLLKFFCILMHKLCGINPNTHIYTPKHFVSAFNTLLHYSWRQWLVDFMQWSYIYSYHTKVAFSSCFFFT